MLALAQAKVYTKELEERQAQALARIGGLEQDLTEHKQLLADKEQFNTITRRINGGINGLADREALYAKALKVLV